MGEGSVDCSRRDFIGKIWGLEELISISGNVAAGPSRSSAYISCPTNKKNSTLATPLHSRSSRIVTIVKELQFDFSIDIGLEEGAKSDVVSQCLDQSLSFVRESTPARRDLRAVISTAT